MVCYLVPSFEESTVEKVFGSEVEVATDKVFVSLGGVDYELCPGCKAFKGECFCDPAQEERLAQKGAEWIPDTIDCDF
jgi:hypothetical protein